MTTSLAASTAVTAPSRLGRAVRQTLADGPVVFVDDDVVQDPFRGLLRLAVFVRFETGEVGWFRFTGRLQPRRDD